MAEFEWMEAPRVRRTTERTAETRDDEIKRRATLFARLGVPKAEAQKRLISYLTWEYERVGKPAAIKRLPALVTEAYSRAGVGGRKKKR